MGKLLANVNIMIVAPYMICMSVYDTNMPIATLHAMHQSVSKCLKSWVWTLDQNYRSPLARFNHRATRTSLPARKCEEALREWGWFDGGRCSYPKVGIEPSKSRADHGSNKHIEISTPSNGNRIRERLTMWFGSTRCVLWQSRKNMAHIPLFKGGMQGIVFGICLEFREIVAVFSVEVLRIYKTQVGG